MTYVVPGALFVEAPLQLVAHTDCTDPEYLFQSKELDKFVCHLQSVASAAG